MAAPMNYTTQISTTTTVSEMQALLVEHGAQRISVEYDGKAPAGLSFALDTGFGQRWFTLPVDTAAMQALLIAEDAAGRLKSGSKKRRTSTEQAERVAWRVMKDWLSAQLSLVATGMVSVDQVMLPYLHADDSGRTLFELYQEQERAALTQRTQRQ